MPTYDSPGGHDRRQQMFGMIFGYRVSQAMVPGGRVGVRTSDSPLSVIEAVSA